MRKSLIATALALVLPATAEEPQAAPPPAPDPEFLVFLGETGSEDPDLIFYMDSRAAKKAVRQAEKEGSKDEHDE